MTTTRVHNDPPHVPVRAEAPSFERLRDDLLLQRLRDLLGLVPFSDSPPLMELTARQPYDATYGRIDVYMPGRWDTESNLVFMDTIVQGGTPGEWTGSASYIYFTPPADASYLVVGHFSGYQTTAHLYGPWGETTAYTPTTSTAGVVLAQYAGATEFEFNLSFTQNNDYGIGYIESIQVYAL